MDLRTQLTMTLLDSMPSKTTVDELKSLVEKLELNLSPAKPTSQDVEINKFIHERCVKEGTITEKQLFEAYIDWCECHNLSSLYYTAFNEAVDALGYYLSEGFWTNLRLKIVPNKELERGKEALHRAIIRFVNIRCVCNESYSIPVNKLREEFLDWCSKSQQHFLHPYQFEYEIANQFKCCDGVVYGLKIIDTKYETQDVTIFKTVERFITNMCIQNDKYHVSLTDLFDTCNIWCTKNKLYLLHRHQFEWGIISSGYRYQNGIVYGLKLVSNP